MSRHGPTVGRMTDTPDSGAVFSSGDEPSYPWTGDERRCVQLSTVMLTPEEL